MMMNVRKENIDKDKDKMIGQVCVCMGVGKGNVSFEGNCICYRFLIVPQLGRLRHYNLTTVVGDIQMQSIEAILNAHCMELLGRYALFSFAVNNKDADVNNVQMKGFHCL